MNDLTKGRPISVIVKFAIPLYIGQLFHLAYGLIDTRIIGSLLGENSLASVCAVTSLCDMLMQFIIGFINGFGIIIAVCFGEKNMEKLRKAAGNASSLTLAITLIIVSTCIAFLSQILNALNVTGDLFRESYDYAFIIILGLFATAAYNYSATVLRSVGDSVTPLTFLIISNVINGMLDYILVKYTNLGVRGAGYATVISEFISAAACFIYMRKKFSILVLCAKDILPDKKIIGKLLPSGLSMSFMISFVLIGSVTLQVAINSFGANIIVAHTGARKVGSMFMMPFSVFSSALATYCGQNMGAGEYGRIKKGIKDALLLLLAWCAFSAFVLFIASPVLVHAVTASSENEVIDTATLYLRVNSILYYVPAVICVLRCSMQGFGDKTTPIISSAIELLGKIVFAFVFAPKIGYWAIILSEPVIWIVMVIPLLAGMKKATRQWKC